MIRNLKALGPMALAALAMSAMFASAAQAVPNGAFTAGLTPNTHTATNLHGEQYGFGNLFETENTTFSCPNFGVTFTASLSGGTATQITVTPTYKDCTAGGLPVTFTMNGCDYTFDQPEAIEGGHTTWTGTVDLVCPAGKTVLIDFYLGGSVTAHNTLVCTITMFPANNLGHIIYKNVSGARDHLTLNAKIAGIPFEGHGAFCPDGNTVADTLTTNSTITVTGKNAAGESDDLWISTD